MLKQSLSQKMLQKLSPQQIQLMKLLQIPTATLEQRIKEELEANPALEEGADVEISEEFSNEVEESSSEESEDFELEEYLTEYLEDDPSSYRVKTDYGQSEDEKTIPIAVENTFHDFLESQLGMLTQPESEDFQIALQIIGSIDEDGYLRRDPSAILDDLMFAQNIMTNEERVLQILSQIQEFDPPGVGARDLQECLAIQLKQKLKTHNGDDRPLLKNALKIIEQYFSEFTKKHYNKLKKHLGVSESELKEIIDEVLKLNPKPASGYASQSQKTNNYIIPDFIIVNRDGELDLTLNSRNAPDLRINDQYRDMLQNYRVNKELKRTTKQDKQAIMFIKQKIDSAKWFIDAIRKRQHTMYKTMYAILQFQYDYFLSGDQRRLKPMILKDIADLTGLDISTVSRVANSKFVQTEFGTKRLKEFFSESLQTKDGEEVSTLEVKNILTDIIGDENKKKPFSDEKLKDLLRKKGYNIARRTVAKYREQLSIPVARLRKEL